MTAFRDLPKYECLRELASRIPEVEPSSVETCLVMIKVVKEVMQAFEAHFGRHGLSEGRFSVMMILLVHPEHSHSPSELADRAGVTRATMTGLLDGLERDGFVAREPHPSDRRTLVARLTERGRDFLHAMLPDHFRRVAGLMAPLSEDERQTLIHLMTKVHEGLPAVTGAREQTP